MYVRVSMCVYTCVCVCGAGGCTLKIEETLGTRLKYRGRIFLVYMYMYVSQVLLSGGRGSWRKKGMYILPWLITKRAEEQRAKD